MNLKDILEYNFLSIGDIHLTLAHILMAIFILLIARIGMWLISRLLNRYFQRKQIDSGRRFAIVQFVKYIIYTGALLMAIEAVGVSLSVLWGGAAALMEGRRFIGMELRAKQYEVAKLWLSGLHPES